MSASVQRRVGKLSVVLRPRAKNNSAVQPPPTRPTVSRAERLERRQQHVKEREARIAAEREDRETQRRQYAEAQRRVLEGWIRALSAATGELVEAAKPPPEEQLPSPSFKIGSTKAERDFVTSLRDIVEYYVQLADKLQLAINDQQRSLAELREARLGALERFDNRDKPAKTQ